MNKTTVFVLIAVLMLIQQGLAVDYAYVVAPRVVKFNHTEDILVGTFGAKTSQAFKVWLVSSKNKQFSVQTGTVLNKETPYKTTLLVTEGDLLDETITDKPRTVELCATVGSVNLQCKELTIDYKTGILIVQTDKPVYTPEQRVHVRVAAVDELLKPMKDTKLTFEITSPSNQTLGRKRLPTGNPAFYKHVFDLPPYPELGIWSASVRYTGQYETEGRALFKVMEYVLPTFEVSVSLDRDVIMKYTKEVTATVKAIYVFGKPVYGKASIMFNITDKRGDSQMLTTAMKMKLANGLASFTINTTDMLRDVQPFPVNKYLRVQAVVIESETGNEEEAYNDQTLFAEHPYKFSFARSKYTFHPTQDYHLKIDILKANGVVEPSPKHVTIRTLVGGMFVDPKQATSSGGHILHIFNALKQQEITFQVSISSSTGDVLSEQFTIYAYKGTKMIHLEVPEREGKTFVDVTSDRQQNVDTGILLLGISRGKIVKQLYREAAGTLHENIDTFKEDLSPRARFVAMYVNAADRTLVTDAIKLDLTAKCKGRGLTMIPEKNSCEPGKVIKFKITGEPYMHVGLSGIDVATLALDDGNVLKNDKLFQELRERDRGCGQGGGLTSGEVLKHAGVQLLIDARINEPASSSHGDPECISQGRRKRDTDFCNGIEPKCCINGIDHAEAVMNGTSDDEKVRMDPESKCYAYAYASLDDLFDKIPTSCILAIYRACVDHMELLKSEVTQVSARTALARTSQYELDLEAINLQNVPSRTYFMESILFNDDVTLSDAGLFTKDVRYPDSITSWHIQAIGVSDTGAMCITEANRTVVMKDFFIQLELPYKAKRLELFEMKATIFNYKSNGDEMMVNLYMQATPGLCYDGEPNKKSHQMTVEIGPNDVESVRFPVMPLKAGKFSITVTAIVTDKSNVAFDSVKKDLIVENEGIQVRETIQICLDYFNRSKDCVESTDRVTTTYPGQNEQLSTIDLTLPNIAITGTGEATGYIQGDIMASVIQSVISGTESVFNSKPHGCGEQTMIYTAPSVFALNYLKTTKQMTEDAEVKGTANIRFGVNREITLFRHSDYSYSCCNARAGARNQGWFHGHTRPSSVWLTSFVMKVFCHAKRVVDDVLDEKNDLYYTLMWLVRHQNGGKFTEIQSVNIRSMMGQMGNDDRTLTAFVLISLLECDIYHTNINSAVESARKYLESVDEVWLKQNPHGLAIITYALALSKSPKRYTLKDWLLSIKVKSSAGTIHWESSGKGANGPNTETTSYALLALMLFDDLETSAGIVSWLTLHQTAAGAFYSTQATAISLQALSKYAIRTSSPITDIQVSLLATNWKQAQYSITNANRNLQTIVNKLPVERGSNELHLTAKIKGGHGRMKIELVYNRPATQTELCAFNVSDIHMVTVSNNKINKKLADKRKCDVCGYCAGDPKIVDYSVLSANLDNTIDRKKRAASDSKTNCIRFSVSSFKGELHGMSIVKFGLQTGVTVIKDDLDKLMEKNENIFLYETADNQEGYVVFYLLTLNDTTNDFVFRVKDSYDPSTAKIRQPAIVDVYDYYNDDISCRKIYGMDGNTGTTFDHTCVGNECKCISSVCARDVRSIITKLLKDNRKPLLHLTQYACDPTNAGYVAVVKITKVHRDNNTKEKLAEGILKQKYYDGVLRLDQAVGEKMVFYWPYHCTFPSLKENGKYLIIGKDGHKFKTANNTEEMRYALSDSALIIEKRQDKEGRLINSVLNRFGNRMKTTGCQN